MKFASWYAYHSLSMTAEISKPKNWMVVLFFCLLAVPVYVPLHAAIPLSVSDGIAGNVFYVATNGNANGNGTIGNPWDLKTALSHPPSIRPGDTIYLRGGKYNVPTADLGFKSFLTGAIDNPIRVMSHPGEWAVIDGNLSFSALKNVTILLINGKYTWFQNFEITNTETGNRKIDISGSNPPERRGTAVDDRGTGTKLINLVIHDAGQGISSYSNGRDSEYYGNVVYNNGWDAPDLLHGHGSYTQNNSNSKLFENNLFFNGFGVNSQMFGSEVAYCRNITWIGNSFFNGGMSWWGPRVENLTVRENHTYNQTFKVGNLRHASNTNAVVEGNYFMHGVFLDEFADQIVFRNNTVWYGTNNEILMLNLTNFWAPAKFTINNNTYFKGSRNPPNGQFKVIYNGAKKNLPIIKRFNGSFAYDRVTGSQESSYQHTRKSWKDDFKFDQNSTYTDAPPTGTKIFIRSNKYTAGRANIIIYNWDHAATVNVDVSAILNPGDTYELRSTQNYFGDIETGTYSGGSISVQMVNRSLAKPIGYDSVASWYHNPLDSSTFPSFGAFVLIKTN